MTQWLRYNNNGKNSRYKSLIKSASDVCLPQWLKYDKNVLRFEGYFDEHVTESAHENWRIRPCIILYYLDDHENEGYLPENKKYASPLKEIIKKGRFSAMP